MYQRLRLKVVIRSRLSIWIRLMSYEPGSPECRSLIDAKENILNAMSSLNRIQEAHNIRTQLLDMYNKLEELHEIRRATENSNL